MHKFKLILEDYYINTTKLILNFNAIYIKWLGIYTSYTCEVLSDPVFIKGQYEYQLRVVEEHKYFLWINYGNRTWNKS